MGEIGRCWKKSDPESCCAPRKRRTPGGLHRVLEEDSWEGNPVWLFAHLDGQTTASPTCASRLRTPRAHIDHAEVKQ